MLSLRYSHWPLFSSLLPRRPGKTRTYEVTITNLTTGQPLTPPVVATHKKPAEIFEVGEAASYSLSQLAENGNNSFVVADLAANKHVSTSWEGSAPLVPVGSPKYGMFSDSVTFSIDSAKGAKYLSIAAMLICTNDGFTGIDGLRLPKKVGDVAWAYSDGYDAGTENNTEYFGDIVQGCQDLMGVTGDAGTGTSDGALAEGGVVTHHNGIQEIADLTVATHGWTNPTILISVERTS